MVKFDNIEKRFEMDVEIFRIVYYTTRMFCVTSIDIGLKETIITVKIKSE